MCAPNQSAESRPGHPPFKAGAEINNEHGFGPNDDQKIRSFLHNSPIYGPILNVPIFDPKEFPPSWAQD